MNIENIRRESLQGQTYKVLKNAILSGQLKRDRTYSVNQLAQILNVSRTPVSSAVQTLSEEGLVSILPNQGFRINKFSENEVKEIFELRKAVEGYILERNIEINTDTLEIHKHLKKQKEYLEKKDVNLFLEEDRKFHEALAKKVKNYRILQTLQNIRDLVTLMNLEVMAEPKRGRQVIEEHTNILKAIDDKNKTTARKALYCHFDNTVSILRERIRRAKISGDEKGKKTIEMK